MRQSLIDLIGKTFIYRYDLPHSSAKIEKSIFSTQNDQCYEVIGKDELVTLIYNSIIEYSFNELDLNSSKYEALHAAALKIRLKYDPTDDDETKLKYGFFGEVLLYSILHVLYKANPIIARGYFYNPLENAETKGYDSYQLIENKGIVELWFGEVKFHISHSTCITSALKNIDKALSDEYLERNILAMQSHVNNFNIKGTKVEAIISKWLDDPLISVASELKNNGMKLVYPIMVLYDGKEKDYDSCVRKVIDYIAKNHTSRKFSISIDYTIFLIIVPLKNVSDIKTEVIQWIESKRPLLS